MWGRNPPPLGEGDREAVEGASRACGLDRVCSDGPPSGVLRTPVSLQGGEI